MPRYFFNLDNSERSDDDEGTVLPSLDVARTEAVLFAGEYLQSNPSLVWDGNRLRVEVRDEQDNLLFEVVVTASDPNRVAGSVAQDHAIRDQL